ncbi:MAG: bifunctional metallophosphatase/5'-nucleotidase [Chloroflexi bacterium]|nr:bifunctional metallophosphatase/5'-nucleotidase [Chloroflexota bacterium]
MAGVMPQGARALLVALALWLAPGAPVALQAQEPPAGLIPLKILALNDLHGGLDSGRQVGGRAVGGAAYLAAYMKQRAAGAQNAVIVGAGDMVGASPPISGLLRDEPTVRVLNAIGLSINAAGNHEFDRGTEELFRLANGGCQPETGCFEGARYTTISTNVLVETTGQTLFSPYVLRDIQGVPVAFIGATNDDVPRITVAGAVRGLQFGDAAQRVNATVAALKAQGVRAMVVLVHQGGSVDRATRQLTGPVADFVDRLDPEVDLVVSSHTHQGYATRRNGILVTQGFSYGTAFVDADLLLDPATGDVVDARAQVVTTYQDQVEPDPEVQAIVDEAARQVGPRINRVVGTSTGNLTRNQTRGGETALGNLVADSYRWATGAQIGMTNPGGLRTDLRSGDLTWGALYAVTPFANGVESLTLTGEQLYATFNQQWSVEAGGGERYRPLQVSGLRVVWDGRRPMGDRIVLLTLESGAVVQRNGRYTVATNSFIAPGGDGFDALAVGRDRQSAGVDVDALVAYVESLPKPFTLRSEGRITRLD